MLDRTYKRTFFGELVIDLVQSAETPKGDDRAARVWLVGKQALFLELLEREIPRRAVARRRDDVDRMLADRGLDKWRSHDAAAERQKRADMAREGHTHTETRTTGSRSKRSEQLRSSKGHVMRVGCKERLAGRRCRGHKGLERRTKVAGLMTGGHGPRLVCRSRMEADRRILLA